MSALLVFYGLLGLAAHVAEPPAVSPTHDAAEHTHLEVPTSDEVVAADTVPAPWGRLADCESGEWDADGNPIPGTARWDYGRPGGFTHEGFEQYHGGLNWSGATWSWLAPEVLGDGYPTHAYDATREQEIAVAERLVELERQSGRGGYWPWPVCSRKVGLR